MLIQSFWDAKQKAGTKTKVKINATNHLMSELFRRRMIYYYKNLYWYKKKNPPSQVVIWMQEQKRKVS